jgi:hypothetical protein
MLKPFAVISLTVVLVVLWVGIVFSQAGSISIFADPGGTNCNLTMLPAPAVTSFYVVHVNGTDVVGSQFRARKPACMNAVFLSDEYVFPLTIGESQFGIFVGYGQCKSGTVHILTIKYRSLGPTEPCCYYPVVPDPSSESGHIEVVDCVDFNIMYGTGGHGIVNANATCSCDVPAEETTWGRLKALYTE